MSSKRIKNIPQPVQPGTCISRCTELDMASLYEFPPRCEGRLWSTGEVTGSCGDACSFIMRKGGAGDPPFISDTDILDEQLKLLMRRSRGNVRYD